MKNKSAAIAASAILAISASTTGYANTDALYTEDGFVLEPGQYIWDSKTHFESVKEATVNMKAAKKTKPKKKPKRRV